MSEAADHAERIRDPEEQLKAMIDIATRADDDNRQTLFERSLARALALPDYMKGRALTLIASKLRDYESELRDAILGAAWSLEPFELMAEVVIEIAKQSTDGVSAVNRVIDLMTARGQRPDVVVLVKMADLLEPSKGKALIEEAYLHLGQASVEDRIAIADHLESEVRRHTLQEALALARQRTWDPREQALLLMQVALRFRGAERYAILRDAVKAGSNIRDEGDRAHMMFVIAHSAFSIPSNELCREEEDFYDDVIAGAGTCPSEFARAHVLTGLAARAVSIGDKRRRELISAAERMSNASARADLLAALAVHAPPSERESLLRGAISAVETISWERIRESQLRSLVETLRLDDVDFIRQTLQIAGQISDASYRISTLCEIVNACSSSAEKDHVLHEALTLAAGTKVEQERAAELSGILSKVKTLDTTSARESDRTCKDACGCNESIMGMAIIDR